MNTIIQTNVPLREKNWFQTGGSAAYYVEPRNAQEFAHAITFMHTHKLPIFILGHGANLLVSDEGFKGLVIKPALNAMSITQSTTDSVLVTAGAGVGMPELINYCLDNQILGLEEFSGIPGTVGGSVYINLHYYEFLLEHFLVNATVIEHETGSIQTVDKEWFNFGYNQSKLQERNHYLVDATFLLKKGSEHDVAYARGRQTEIIRHRQKRYPTARTCGSFFRNFKEHEVTLTSSDKKMIYVAYYLDKIGVKGQLRVGDALVSHQHANMIVNLGNATSADIITLARTMQQRVFEQFGIIPQPECQLLGFDTYPLMAE
ncbi:UDP-N-acetylenolpyruvoylglucosamine reductase [Candidatus Dependentiae bacterium Noda2021]|nr:UDP-N-acetylenolpyruvoylglucosamine reductase [Candidatus Dependentiae bacterium Noda2021]